MKSIRTDEVTSAIVKMVDDEVHSSPLVAFLQELPKEGKAQLPDPIGPCKTIVGAAHGQGWRN